MTSNSCSKVCAALVHDYFSTFKQSYLCFVALSLSLPFVVELELHIGIDIEFGVGATV